MSGLSHKRLLELVHFDPVVGVFIRRVANGTAKTGDICGYVRPDGYIAISVDGRGSFLGHRLAWFYVTGEWPSDHTDHINGSRSDNRFSNLRKATARQNCSNTGPQTNNTSGVKGVYWSRIRRKWVAQIGANRRVLNLGGFDRLEDAVAARKQAEIDLQGEFRWQTN